MPDSNEEVHEDPVGFEEILGISIPEVTKSMVPVSIETTTTESAPTPVEQEGDKHGEEDYRQIRKNLKSIIEKSEEAVDRILDLAKEGEEPRAYEVVADLLRTNMEANERLINLHKQRKELQKKPADVPKVGNVTNNNTIIATTTELLDIINKNRKKIAQQDIIDQSAKSEPK